MGAIEAGVGGRVVPALVGASALLAREAGRCDEAGQRERVEREDWPFPYLWDESQAAAREWGARVTPHLFVLDAELRLRYEGAADGDHQDPGRRAEWLRAALDALLGGGDPPASTEAVGCSIKWRT